MPHPKEHIGLKCKRLIDLSRVHYLQNKGFNSRLVYYVERETSLENALLLATSGEWVGQNKSVQLNSYLSLSTGFVPATPPTGSVPAPPPITGSVPAHPPT